MLFDLLNCQICSFYHIESPVAIETTSIMKSEEETIEIDVGLNIHDNDDDAIKLPEIFKQVGQTKRGRYANRESVRSQRG